MSAPRVLFDTNLYLNYLLSPDPAGSAVEFALIAAADGTIELLLPEDVISELAATIERRPYLSARITAMDLQALLRRVRSFATPLPPLDDDPSSLSRDPHDDCLLALAVQNDVDFLVTRDRDLLTLRSVLRADIVSPATLVAWLRSRPLPE